MMMQHPPLPIYPPDSDQALGLVYFVPPEALVTDLRAAVTGQLALKGFEFFCGDGRTPLHPHQEEILRVQDVWGTGSPLVRLRFTGSDYGLKHARSFLGWCGQHAHLPGHCLMAPLAAGALATLLSFTVGMLSLSLAQLAHAAHPGAGPVMGAKGAVLAADGAVPMDDYQYYLYTFRKVWEATLNALVSMINTYLNGPVMVLCKMGEQIITCVEKCVLAYLEDFKYCWEVILNALASMINNYVTGPVAQLCRALDDVIHAVQDCVIKYLEVFSSVFTAALKPEHTVLLCGMTIIVFLGTALVVHVALRDTRKFLPWACCRRKLREAEEPMMMAP